MDEHISGASIASNPASLSALDSTSESSYCEALPLEEATKNHVALFVSGGIAVYKACEVLRALQKAGCDVRVCMTDAATKMVGTQTFEALSGHHVTTTLFGDAKSPIAHIDLAEWADIALVCPATANIIAKMAHGIADDAASSSLLAMYCPVVVAPAMNVHMWQNEATQANVETLRERGYVFAGPVEGRLACGDTGIGKLADVSAIAEVVLAALCASSIDISGVSSDGFEQVFHALETGENIDSLKTAMPQDLSGKHILVTAGPTHETIDPVRYLANSSTGKMGFAIASAAAAHGAKVTLVTGPTSLVDPLGVTTVHVTSAAQMLEACLDAFEGADAAVLSAAVCDYRPKNTSDHKLKKDKERLDVLELEETTDILATLSAQKNKRIVVGFAAETNDVIENASSKLKRKGCDLIVANDVSSPESTFGSDTNKVYFVDKDGATAYPCMPKREVAEAIISEVVARLWDYKG